MFSSRNYRIDKHILIIAGQAILVLGLWFILCGYKKVSGIEGTIDF